MSGWFAKAQVALRSTPGQPVLILFNLKVGGQFGAENGGHFAAKSGGHFHPEIGGHVTRNLQGGIILGVDHLTTQDLREQKDLSDNRWTVLKTKTKLPPKSSDLLIGVWLVGEGSLRVDNFEVLIDGNPIEEFAVPMGWGVKLDHEFDQTSKIEQVELTDQNIEASSVVCKIWGLLKYYHPSISAGQSNWDYELFRILSRVLAEKDLEKQRLIILDWVKLYGDVNVNEPKAHIHPDSVKLSPDFSWVNDKELGETLMEILQKIICESKPQSPYYVSLTTGVGNPTFDNETRYPSNYPDTGYRLLSLFRFWNIIQYYYPHRNLLKAGWQSALKKYIPKFVDAKDELDYKLCVLSLITEIEDSHAAIVGNDDVLNQSFGYNTPPITVRFIEEKLVVIDKGKIEGIKAGDVISEINGAPVEDIIRKLKDITPASNHPTKLRTIAQNILRTKQSFLTLKISDGKSVIERKIQCLQRFQSGDKEKWNYPDSSFRLLRDNVAYLHMGMLTSTDIKILWPSIKNSRSLIIDLRCYPADFTVFTLGNYLVHAPTDFVSFSIPSLEKPGLFLKTNGVKVGTANSDKYRGRVIVLVDENTQSSAEFHALAFSTSESSIIVGSTTAGADGNISMVHLPGNIIVTFTGIGVYHPDGRDTQIVGVKPNISVRPTIEGIRKGRDEVLERALQLAVGEK